jgi:predicted DNA-binding transcriptional regulator AlpA
MALTEELKALIADEVLTKPEVIEMLGITRQGMYNHLKKGSIKPFKKMGNTELYFKEEVLKFKDQLEKNRSIYRPYDEKSNSDEMNK